MPCQNRGLHGHTRDPIGFDITPSVRELDIDPLPLAKKTMHSARTASGRPFGTSAPCAVPLHPSSEDQ